MINPLVDTWQIHSRINLYLLDALESEDLSVATTKRSRSVGDIFAHMHNVRLMWLKEGAPDLPANARKIERGEPLEKDLLISSLSASAEAISSLVSIALGSGGKVRGFRPHVHAFVGYLISHESHHRGQIASLLREAGRPLDRSVSYGMWEWGKR